LIVEFTGFYTWKNFSRGDVPVDINQPLLHSQFLIFFTMFSQFLVVLALVALVAVQGAIETMTFSQVRQPAARV